MIDVNELLEEAIRETENLNDGEVFLVKDLFKGYDDNIFFENCKCKLDTCTVEIS